MRREETGLDWTAVDKRHTWLASCHQIPLAETSTTWRKILKLFFSPLSAYQRGAPLWFHCVGAVTSTPPTPTIPGNAPLSARRLFRASSVKGTAGDTVRQKHNFTITSRHVPWYCTTSSSSQSPIAHAYNHCYVLYRSAEKYKICDKRTRPKLA